MEIRYCHRPSLLTTPERQSAHRRIHELLDQLGGKGTASTVEDIDKKFPIYEPQRAFIGELGLRDFAMRRKAGLGRIFGSNRAHFSWLPPQFLLVYENHKLIEVFPYQSGQNQIDPLEFLECIAAGKPWTTRSRNGVQGRRHKIIVDRIKANHALLGPGLTLKGADVQVCQDAETGFVDLVFERPDGRPLLVEVKVGANELAKGVGQILWHQQLYAAQNRIPKDRIDVGICCPYVSPQFRTVCEDHSIRCFELGSSILH